MTQTAAQSSAEVALRCDRLVKRYGELIAVNELSLEIAAGECFGLLGPNGAGKTTTVEMMEGLQAPTAGTIELLGMRWGTGRDAEIRHNLGIALQETQFADRLTVRETIRLFSSFYRGPRGVEEVIGLVELEEKAATRIMNLSGGQRQRVALACALVGRPQILFLDEPTTGLDPQARLQIWGLIERFRAEGGTVLLTTHYMDEAARLCDRVAIIDHGRLIALDTPIALIEGLGARQIIELNTEAELQTAPLEGLPGVRDVSLHGDTLRLGVNRIAETMPGLLSEVERQGTRIATMSTHQPTLEDVFVHHTGRSLRDG